MAAFDVNGNQRAAICFMALTNNSFLKAKKKKKHGEG